MTDNAYADDPAHATFDVHGAAEPATPLVLDSPHSGTEVPADMRAALTAADLADGTDAFVDALWRPAVDRGAWLVAARAVRTYVDCNRHHGDVDLALFAPGTRWPDAYEPSGKAALGKAVCWRTLDDGRPIYDRTLAVDEVRARVARHHRPYHAALAARIAATHARFGASWHLDCHSMNAVGGAMGEGGAGVARADVVLGDRDGTTCDPAFTEHVRATMAGLGYDVAVNDPFKGVELVRAHADPANERHSLQVEVNKRLYLDEATQARHAGFERLQRDLMALVDAVLAFARERTPER